MESKKLSFRELQKMATGTIPMTEEGQKQISALKEHATKMPVQFGSVRFPKIDTDAFRIQLQSLIPVRYDLSAWGASLTKMQDALNSLKPTVQAINLFVERIKNDPDIQRRWALLNQKSAQIDSLIENWKGHLVYRMENRPFDDFAHHFEYACYDLLDNATNNDELDAIGKSDFIRVMQYVADKIVIADRIEQKKWVKAHEKRTKELPPAPATISTFAELLKEPKSLQLYINALHEFQERNRKTVIDQSGQFVNRRPNKAILLAWRDTLQVKGKFRADVTVSDKELARLLNEQFPGLNFDTIDASIIRKETKSRAKYQADFLQLIR